MITKREGLNLIYYISFSIIVVTIFLGAWFAIDVVLLAFAGILFAIFLRSINDILKKLIPMPDHLSISIVLVFIALLSILTIVAIVPIVSEQIAKLAEEIPDAWRRLLIFLNRFLNLQPIFSVYQEIDIEKLFRSENGIIVQVTNVLSTTFGFFGSIFIFIIIGIFLACSPDVYEQGFLKLIPKNKREKAQEVLALVTITLRWWLIGKFFSMSIVGVSTSIGLWLLDIPMAFTLGLFAAILTFIPNIGPIISIIPAILIAIIQSPISAVYVIILYAVIQFLESYIITPLIMNKTISEPPALIICIQLIMAILIGALGLALAAPFLVVLSVIIKTLYMEERT
jgi:predicted PurR-regulated permease PerM